MFSDKLSELMQALNAKNTDIARLSGLDASNISRLKTGDRVPVPTSPTTEKLATGICEFAQANELLPKLSKILLTDSIDYIEIKQSVIRYLFGDIDSSDALNTKLSKKITPELFGKRLNTVMELTDTTNVQLSKLVHIDSSSISRFRNGVRIPKEDSNLSIRICEALIKRAEKTNKIAELSKTIHAKDNFSLSDHLFKWLYDTGHSEDTQHIEQTLKNIAKFSPTSFEHKFDPSRYLEKDTDIYIGNRGLRLAVIRFLTSALKSDSRQLLLYSDRPMDWMTEDKTFMLDWAYLMIACAKKGIKIKIIHNIKRSTSEMISAIDGWLPLYMTGMTESYSFAEVSNKRFDRTLFINEGIASIEGTHTKGTEKSGIYRYDTDKRIIAARKKEYNRLMKETMRLVQIEDRDKAVETVNTGKEVFSFNEVSEKLPFKNVEIVFSDKAVAVTRLLPLPAVTFVFTDTYMCEAFKDYLSNIKGK